MWLGLKIIPQMVVYGNWVYHISQVAVCGMVQMGWWLDTEGMGAYSGISSFAASEAPGVPQNFRPCGWSPWEAACPMLVLPRIFASIDVQYKVWHRLANAVAPWYPLVFDFCAFQTLAWRSGHVLHPKCLVGEIGSVIPVVGSYQLLADCRYVSSSIYTLQAWGDLQIPACFITNKSHTPRIGQREYLQLHKKIHHFHPFSTFHGKIYGILWLYPSPHAVPRKATRQVGWILQQQSMPMKPPSSATRHCRGPLCPLRWLNGPGIQGIFRGIL